MKKLFLVVASILVTASFAWGAGSCVPSSTETIDVLSGKEKRKVVTLTCTGDGSIAAYSFSPITYGVQGWYLYHVKTNPGTSAPTDEYDITLMVDGEDIAGGLLADRSATATQTVLIAPATRGYEMLTETMAITFTNNAANPSVIVLTLKFTSN